MAGLILYVAVIGVAFLTVQSAFKKTNQPNRSSDSYLEGTFFNFQK
jgi:hypothetical protein